MNSDSKGLMTGRKTVVGALAAVLAGCLMSASASAGVSPEEAARLGKDLTVMGAEEAGNAEGTIPAFNGGGVNPLPAGFVPGSGTYIDPYAGEKPRLVIDNTNWKEHEAKLTEGTKAMFEKWGDEGFRLDVYPTHRSFAAPQWFYDNTVENATSASLVSDGLKIEGAKPGTPFPIPSDPMEVMWNHMIRWMGTHAEADYDSYYVDGNGKPVLSTNGTAWFEFPMYNPQKDYGDLGDRWALLRIDYNGPPRRAGEILLVHEPGSDYTEGKGRNAWQYLVGQRRVRRAPAVAFDTPNPGIAGTSTYDDSYVFNGSPERYDWTLIGKQEIYAPYNTYDFVFNQKVEDMLGKHFFKPEFVRWELHRVWVVEAELKEGFRHMYKKRRYYIDEDSWTALAGEVYDGQDKLWRVHYAYFAPLYDIPAGNSFAYGTYDLLSNVYNINTKPIPGGFRIPEEQKDTKFFSPQGIARTGIR
ncbi:MAG: DUF1329 domain-containing protein [Gammaproteobacteria bacterium]|jgi:hypothetical protein|nr:DUF1329 domain-containing protein [Gammaproteobacteria bacterium]